MIFAEDIESYFGELKSTLDSIDREEINNVLHRLIEARERGAMIYIFGNGGSASTASHFVNDFNKGVSEQLSKRFKFICLNDNVSTVMAVANDLHYSQVFKFQLQNFLTSNDVVIGISGSGNSDNVVEAMEYSNSIGAETIALSGYTGGKIREMAKHSIHVPINDMQKVEDAHMIIDHLMMTILKKHLVSA